jgi:hypothetical protein
MWVEPKYWAPFIVVGERAGNSGAMACRHPAPSAKRLLIELNALHPVANCHFAPRDRARCNATDYILAHWAGPWPTSRVPTAKRLLLRVRAAGIGTKRRLNDVALTSAAGG